MGLVAQGVVGDLCAPIAAEKPLLGPWPSRLVLEALAWAVAWAGEASSSSCLAGPRGLRRRPSSDRERLLLEWDEVAE